MLETNYIYLYDMVTFPMLLDEHGCLVQCTLIYYLISILVCKDRIDFINAIYDSLSYYQIIEISIKIIYVQ